MERPPYKGIATWGGDGDDSWLIELLGKWTAHGDSLFTKTSKDSSRQGADRQLRSLLKDLLTWDGQTGVKAENLQVSVTYRNERAYEAWKKRNSPPTSLPAPPRISTRVADLGSELRA